MIERRGFFGRLAALVGIFSLPAQTGTESERSARKGDSHKAPLIIDLYADRKHFEQYQVFDAETKEQILLPVFYADEGRGIIKFFDRPWMKDRKDPGEEFEGLIRKGFVQGESHSWAYAEVRRRIRIIKKLTPEQRFEARAAIT